MVFRDIHLAESGVFNNPGISKAHRGLGFGILTGRLQSLNIGIVRMAMQSHHNQDCVAVLPVAEI